MDEKQLQSLLLPGAYPEPADDTRLVQTHVSWIFLAGKFAYKIKKPVNFGFLDFSTLERRRFYCEEEVRLNRRLCPEIYLGVLPVCAAPAGAAFHGGGPVIDYAVKMVRLPDERMADRLLAAGELTPEDVKSIAATIAAFHQQAAQSRETDCYGSLAAITANWEENFRQAEEFIGTTLSRQDFDAIRERVVRFLAVAADRFTTRMAEGFIRECDGDIHLENICLIDRPCIFDCIEFNDRFRYSDTVADIAFLLMDLDFHGRRDLAGLCLAEYLQAANDTGAAGLVSFYSLYRAFVRGKVESFRLNDAGIPTAEKQAALERAARYFRLASHYTLREQSPRALLAVCGLSGSGKSTIAAVLAGELGLELLSTDRLRKELAGVPLWQHDLESYGTGLYSPDRSAATYRELFRRAGNLLGSGLGVIVDATCQRQSDRERLQRLAVSQGVPLFFIVVRTPEESIRQRLTERVRQGTAVSDGRWGIYLRQKLEFEPVQVEEGVRIDVDGSAPLDLTIDAVLDAMGLAVAGFHW